MSLKARLDLLRRQSGSTADAAEPTPTPGGEIAERLRRLGADGRRSRPSRAKGDPAVLAAAMDGEFIADGVMLIQRMLPLTHRHGRIRLADVASAPAELPMPGAATGGDMMFLDTETTGLAGGTGTAVFMVGAARICGAQLTVRQYLLTAFSGEAAMLEHLRGWIGDAATLVTYNGKSFDLPLLRDRYRLSGFRDRFAPDAHLDLLHPVRRLFDRRWPDCRLVSVEERLLGYRRENDMPGSQAPLAWFDFIHGGDGGRLPRVAEHNLWDLVSLAALLPALAEAFRRPGAFTACPYGAARAWLAAGDEDRALEVLSADPRALDERSALELARLYRRQRQWHEAVAIWEGLAAGGSHAAAEELAKYHEHERRDWRTALRYASRLPDSGAATRRRERLGRKIEASGAPDQLDLN
jgi:uncharacterized protein YprB with RNaseH-like and TPR domain